MVLCTVNLKNKNMTVNKRDTQIMFRWLIALLTWTILCFISIIWVKWNFSIGVWLIVIGVVKHIKREDYRKWYNRVYDTNY